MSEDCKRYSRRGLAALALGVLLTGCGPRLETVSIDTGAQSGDVFGSYAAGRLAHEVGDPLAADFLLAAADRDPDNPVILNRAFLALLTVGRMEDAGRLARQLREIGADSGLARLFETLDAFRRGDYQTVDELVAGLHATGFESLILPVLKAWTHAARGDREAALAALGPLRDNRALAPFAKVHTAYILDYLDDHDDALAVYESLTELRGVSLTQPVLAHAALLQKTGRHDAALAALNEFTERFMRSELIAHQRERLIAGKRIESHAAAPAPALGLILFRAANEMSREEASRPAIVYARMGHYLSPRLEEGRLELARLLAGAEMYRLATELLEDIGPNDALFGSGRRQLAWILHDSGQHRAALGSLDSYLMREPESVAGWSTLGDIHRSAEDYEEAIDAYSRALSLPPEGGDAHSWFLYFARGIAYERSGDWDLAEADFLKSLDIDPDQPQVLNYLGYSWIDRGMHLDRGTEMIRKAVEMRPQDGFIIDSLGWAFYLQGEYEQAVKYLERAVEREPSDPTINDHLGDAYWKVGRRAEARFQWQHALTAGPDSEDDRQRIAEKLDYGLELANLDRSDQPE